MYALHALQDSRAGAYAWGLPRWCMSSWALPKCTSYSPISNVDPTYGLWSVAAMYVLPSAQFRTLQVLLPVQMCYSTGYNW